LSRVTSGRAPALLMRLWGRDVTPKRELQSNFGLTLV
jgi:hypothetical protein